MGLLSVAIVYLIASFAVIGYYFVTGRKRRPAPHEPLDSRSAGTVGKNPVVASLSTPLKFLAAAMACAVGALSVTAAAASCIFLVIAATSGSDDSAGGGSHDATALQLGLGLLSTAIVGFAFSGLVLLAVRGRSR